ncbi:MAG TPA: hypothetical protein VGO52_14320 [Hyphomonadaceae bacterium]|jgi:hypothetical protein|nr:hypothetical protein [Hyphomonadaceae bacterium]
MTRTEVHPLKAKTMWLGVAGCLASVGLFQLYPMVSGSGDLLGEVQAGDGQAFVTECMEAALMWKHDTLDFRLAATAQERTVLRGQCSAAFASGSITPEMRDVRDGVRLVRDGAKGVHTTSVF